MGKSEEETKETEKNETEEEDFEYTRQPSDQTYLLTESKCEFE